MSFIVNINEFEGPLDLMLFLIKDNKLDLFDLDLVVLTNQYIKFIHQAKENNLEIASEYLSEMAGLIEIKSKRLLPRPKVEDDLDEINDPNSLVSRLLEYQRYKEASLELAKRFNERQYQINLTNTHKLVDNVKSNQPYDNDIYDLIKAMTRVLKRQEATQIKEVTYTKKEYSIDERIDQIRYFYRKTTNPFKLSDLFKVDDDLEFKIVTFLSVLDLILMKELVFSYNAQKDELLLQGATS